MQLAHAILALRRTSRRRRWDASDRGTPDGPLGASLPRPPRPDCPVLRRNQIKVGAGHGVSEEDWMTVDSHLGTGASTGGLPRIKQDGSSVFS